jgi:hypothetical protein
MTCIFFDARCEKLSERDYRIYLNDIDWHYSIEKNSLMLRCGYSSHIDGPLQAVFSKENINIYHLGIGNKPPVDLLTSILVSDTVTPVSGSEKNVSTQETFISLAASCTNRLADLQVWRNTVLLRDPKGRERCNNFLRNYLSEHPSIGEFDEFSMPIGFEDLIQRNPSITYEGVDVGLVFVEGAIRISTKQKKRLISVIKEFPSQRIEIVLKAKPTEEALSIYRPVGHVRAVAPMCKIDPDFIDVSVAGP